MVKKVAKRIVKKGTQLQRVVSEATKGEGKFKEAARTCLLYTSPSPRDGLLSRMPSSA